MENVDLILNKLRPIREEGFAQLYPQEDYVDLVLSLGLSEGEWAQLQEAFGVFWQAGKKALQENHMEEAVELLERALLIRQQDIDTLSALSEVHLRLWRRGGEAAHAQLAERFARHCLQLDPQHEAAQTRLAILKPKVSVNQSMKIQPILIIAAAVAIIIFAVILFLLMTPEPTPIDAGSDFNKVHQRAK